VTGDLVARCVAFCRAVRERGIPVATGESVLAARVLAAVGVSDPEDLRFGLRAALAVRPEQVRWFDRLFDELWLAAGETPRTTTGMEAPTPPPTPPPNANRAPPVTLDRWMRAPDASAPAVVAFRAASDREWMIGAEPPDLGDTRAEFRRLADRMARRLAMRASRRWRPVTRGALIDLRRTARHSLRTGGDPIRLARRVRRIRRTRLVAICDVSGSMERYARFLLQFLYALQRSFAQVETFVFSTRLTRTSPLLDRGRWEEVVPRIAREVKDWSGGTRIGASLSTFVRDWIRLVDSRTVVLLMSDGWETGDPAILGAAMRAIHQRAGRVIWLNPLLSNDDFAPVTRGMQAVMPHIDLMAPCHDLAALERLVRELWV
jgi:uncharacterized protein with von Willebrand factor type A (vWA) domain